MEVFFNILFVFVTFDVTGSAAKREIIFPSGDTNYAEYGSPCESQPGVIGSCKPIKECEEIARKISTREVYFSDVKCDQNLVGKLTLVCCPKKKTEISNPATLIISPPAGHINNNCGLPYLDYGFSVRNKYPGNETAEFLKSKGFTIIPLDMHLDHLTKFEYTNGTFTGLHEVFTAMPIPGGAPARRIVAVYMALIGNGKDWYCDGALINDQWVLTAAHCFELLSEPLQNIVIRLGEYDWSNDSYSETEDPIDYSIDQVIKHPFYQYPSAYHDLALIKLNKSRPLLRDDITPVCLPWGNETNRNHVNNTLTITGWGATFYLGPSTPVLQEANVTVFNPSVCDKSYSKLVDYNNKFPNGIKERTSLCAGDKKGGIDACQGDSGGPIVYLNKNTHRYNLAGIISTGFGCGLKEFPGIYVPINNPLYLSWIKNVAFNSKEKHF